MGNSGKVNNIMVTAMSAYAQRPPYDGYGYRSKTTFWGDFTVAEIVSGVDGVKDTFRRAYEEWKDDKVCATELSLVLNHKVWQWAETDKALAKLYQEYWRKLDDYIVDNWKGDELTYYIRTTD